MANWNKLRERYSDKHVLVLGAARSGISAAHLLLKVGAHVVINDRQGEPTEIWVQELSERGAHVILGSHPDKLLERGFDLIVKNPGIPYSHPYIKEGLARNIPVITEVELGFSLLEGTCIGITGSNGKTTTTSLVAEMFQTTISNTIIAGNIGKAFCEQVQKCDDNSVMVTELSSFQLKGTLQFRPHIAALLNIYPHHLDYHGTLDDYITSKLNIFHNQTEQDYAVINWDQELSSSIATKLSAKLYGFSRQGPVERGTFIVDYGNNGEEESWIVFKDEEMEPVPIIPLKQIKLPGKHNLENILASITIAMIGGIHKEKLAEVVRHFRGVEHRLEFVREKDGVSYYNDSKATNPEAMSHALESFTTPVILIAGGLDRGVTYTELQPLFTSHVKHLIAYGEIREQLQTVAHLAGIDVSIVNHVEDGVTLAHQLAQKGDVVLLSPGAASWDLYKSFEERGRMFKEAVHNLK